MLDETRKHYFRIANTTIFNTQFEDIFIEIFNKNIKVTKTRQYNISKRNIIVRLICESTIKIILKKTHTRRLDTIRARRALYNREKTRNIN